MASFIVDTAQVLSATTGADSVWVQSGAAGSSTVLGLDGNDTITVLSAITDNSATNGTIIRGAGGNDSIYINSSTFSATDSKIYAGAGSDTITFNAAGSAAVLNTNEGADLVNATGGVVISAATFSTGSDTLLVSGTMGDIGMGNGHDVVSANVLTMRTSNTIKLGDGRDTINVSSLAGNSAVTVQGDTDTNYGADSINISVADITALVVKGQGGNDTITISGASTKTIVQGNGGDDSVVITDTLVDGVTVGGGQGADTIRLSAAFNATTTAFVYGGNGNDSIFVNLVTKGVDASAIALAGGAGADTISFSATQGTMSGSTLGTIELSSLSESTIAGYDVVELDVAKTADGTLLNVDFNGAANLSAISSGFAAGRAGNATSYVTVNASGVVTFQGDLSNTVGSSVTAATEAVDKVVISEGQAAIFAVGTSEYLFIQGGSAGTSDDGLIQLGNMSAKSLNDIGSAIEITFSGVAS